MLTTIARGLVRLSAWIAPAAIRARWREEWLAEIDRVLDDGRSPTGVALRALGAPVDALVLRWRQSSLLSGSWLGGLLSDVRFSLRLLRRQPMFAAGAWITLALGIGGISAVYTVFYSVLLRPLPVADEDSLVVAYATRRDVGDDRLVPYPQFDDWRASGVFRDMAALNPRYQTLTSDDGLSRRITVAGVSLNFFHLVGARAALGRVLDDADAAAAGTPAVISDALWRGHFGARPDILGTVATFGDLTVTIVGVTQPGLHRWREVQAWVPIRNVLTPEIMSSPGYHTINPIARLAPGQTLRDAEARLDAVDRTLGDRGRYPETADLEGVRLARLREEVVPARIERVLLLLMASVGLTWLVVCANLSSLLLARSSRRSAELAVRRALGAARGRLVRQLMMESASLALPGGAFGILAAFWCLPLAVRALPTSFLPPDVVWIDAPVIVVAGAVVAVSAVAFGLLPALRAARTIPHSNLHSSERVGSRTSGPLWALLAAEVAVGLIVITSAVLLTKSVAQIERVDLGFDANNVLGLRIGLPARSGDEARYAPAQRELLQRVSALPGVDAATIGGIFWPNLTPRSSIWLEDGRGFLNGEAADQAFAPSVGFVGPDFFVLHGIRVRRGREPTLRDDFSQPRVVVVNEAMAAALWPGEDPIGKRVNFGGRSTPNRPWREPWHEVVGVVPDIRHAGVDLPARPTAYRAALQYPIGSFDLVVRASVPPATLWPSMRQAVTSVDPGILIYEQIVLADVVSEAHAAVTYSARALSLFASMTALISAFGVYSVLAYAVAQRRRELGIRIALGAAPARLARDVGRQVLWVLLPGLALGLLAAVWAARSLGALLYDVEPTDPWAFGLAALALTVLAALAAAVPARRAARVDPVEALRS